MDKERTTDERMQTMNIDREQHIHDLKSTCTFYRVNTECNACPKELKKICNTNWKVDKNYPCTWDLENYSGY